MINVLVLNSNLVLASGITRVIKNLVDYTDRTVIKYVIATLDDKRNDMVEYFMGIGVEVVIIPNITVFGFNKISAFFSKLLSDYQIDIVHSHFFQLDGIIIPMAKKNNIKYISHSHSSKLSESKWKDLRNKLLFSKGSKQADCWAACSRLAGLALFGNQFVNSKKSVLIKNGIDCRAFEIDDKARRIIRAEYGISDTTKVIGHIGRFSPTKNQRFIVPILKELISEGENVKLLFVGNGPTIGYVHTLVKRLHVEKDVVFVGEKHNTQAYLNAFDVFIMPSIHEGLGITAIEAQACGLDCVISDTIPEEVDIAGITRMSLQQPIHDWIEVIKNLSFSRHPGYNNLIVEAGYDIRDVAKQVQSLYFQIIHNDA